MQQLQTASSLQSTFPSASQFQNKCWCKIRSKVPQWQPCPWRATPSASCECHVTGAASMRCAASQHYSPAAVTHYPPGYEMVAPKLRPDKAQQYRQRHYQQMFQVAAGDGQLMASGRSQVLELLREGQNTYTNTDAMKAAVAKMEQENPTQIPAQLINSGAMQGTWKVFHAPHISTMSQYMLNTKFEPIIYRLGPNNTISSNVKYTSMLGNGWLSAAGTVKCMYDNSVEIQFNRFWVDGEDKLRDDLVAQGSQEGTGYVANDLDQVITNIGRMAFFPQFAVFPVHYLDDDLVVFEFTPLSSKISARRVTHSE